MINSPKTRALVARPLLHPRAAFQWGIDEVLEALNECKAKQDVVGASALFSRLNEEHKCFFGYDFRQRTTKSELPASEVQEAIVLNCSRAAQFYELIRAQVALTKAA